LMFTRTYLSPSILVRIFFMNVCMYAWLCNENSENIVRFKSIMLESKVTTPFGKDYGFICTCNKGSTKFPNYNFPYEYIGV